LPLTVALEVMPSPQVMSRTALTVFTRLLDSELSRNDRVGRTCQLSGLLNSWAAADNEQMSDRFFGLLPGGAVQLERAGAVLAGTADGEPIMVRPLGLRR